MLLSKPCSCLEHQADHVSLRFAALSCATVICFYAVDLHVLTAVLFIKCTSSEEVCMKHVRG